MVRYESDSPEWETLYWLCSDQWEYFLFTKIRLHSWYTWFGQWNQQPVADGFITSCQERPDMQSHPSVDMNIVRTAVIFRGNDINSILICCHCRQMRTFQGSSVTEDEVAHPSGLWGKLALFATKSRKLCFTVLVKAAGWRVQKGAGTTALAVTSTQPPSCFHLQNILEDVSLPSKNPRLLEC